MKYRKLGRTGFEVSEMAHGLWGMSGWTGSDDKESLAALQLATDLGCNFFDTAWAYGDGKSDGLLGEILYPELFSSQSQQAFVRSFEDSAAEWKVAGPAVIQVSGRFSRGPCFQACRPDPEKAPGGRHRCAAVSRLGRQLDRRPGISQHGGEAQARRNHPSFRPQPQSLGTGKRPQGFAHRAGGRGAGDPQHFRSGARGQTFSRLPGIEYRRDRARAARRGQPGRKDDAGNKVSQRRLARHVFWPEESCPRPSREWKN